VSADPASEKELLILEAQNCATCPRMKDSRRVLTDSNGDWKSKVLFVAEAPGRLGAEKTGIPLYGDRTGERFEELLGAMGWARTRVFLTNAVLCNPRDGAGNNDKPSATEIRNCLKFLRRTIEVINPALVIALGRVALDDLKDIQPHDCSIKASCGQVVPWGVRCLGVLYHPSPRTQTQRSWADQLNDARAIAFYAQMRLEI
jgi:uracil-DNA glycosylase family 4